MSTRRAIEPDSRGAATGIDAGAMIGLLRTMLLIRGVDAAWGEAYLNEEIGGIPPALSTGQEAVSAGACAALEDGDFVFTTHRGQAPQIARGLDPDRVMAELYCRRPGYNKGKSYHVTDVSRGVIGMGGIVAAQVPVAGGMALAQKMRGTDRVSLAFFGDGAANEGAVHEAANLAAMWTSPLILLCENNGYCITQPTAVAIKARSIAERGAGYGLPHVAVDGNDVLAVKDAVAAAVARARAGGGATFIEARTARLGGHLVHDPQTYRTEEEISAAWKQCPIARFRTRLLAEGFIGAEDCAKMEADVADVVARAVAFARQSPFPEPAEAFEDLWA
ncbi:MAG: thiamine pyrophosphate-dependent dehydrogenase E1 component subunit alpha [Hyphomicrobiaceae bacterium]|nr:thiamine pyrophosphate-dependent dehydrogenase E1 component subunit alpha [Hyphomicrobiaceae bacterium]